MVKIFIDFDGTVTKKDVGDELFRVFSRTSIESYLAEYRRGNLSAVSCYRLQAESCGSLNRRNLDDLISEQEIDSSVLDFFDFCRQNGMECRIVSDGMDYYIKKILNKSGLGRVPFYANRLELVPYDSDGRVCMKISFPYTDEECDRCACCKRNIMLTRCADEDLIMYIGEGYSDRCPVRYADVVFAKDELRRFCQHNKIPHFEYKSFSDIIRFLNEFRCGTVRELTKRFKKRRQAQIACRDVFIGG